MPNGSPNREEERAQMAQAEQAERELRARGVYIPSFDEKDSKTIQEIIKVGAIAKQVARTEVSVKVMRDGRLVPLTEPIGKEETIFMALLQTRLARGNQQ